jgi:uncharacterized membrane protein YphA (DoxX/SURF4 family)
MHAVAANPIKARLVGLVPWALSAYVAFIFIWYLQFKFTGGEGSVWLFSILTDWLGFPGHEKAMRIFTGGAELVASILILVPATQVVGAAMAFGIMFGAIFFHVASPLGIDPYGDGGELFREACTVLVFALVVMVMRREQGFAYLDRLRSLVRRAR